MCSLLHNPYNFTCSLLYNPYNFTLTHGFTASKSNTTFINYYTTKNTKETLKTAKDSKDIHTFFTTTFLGFITFLEINRCRNSLNIFLFLVVVWSLQNLTRFSYLAPQLSPLMSSGWCPNSCVNAAFWTLTVFFFFFLSLSIFFNRIYFCDWYFYTLFFVCLSKTLSMCMCVSI